MAYKRFEDEDIVLSSETVSTPIWSNGAPIISSGSWATSSGQTSGLSGQYYIDVEYTSSEETEDLSGTVQFAIAYANVSGSGLESGSITTGSYSENDRSIVVYGQYRSLVLGDEESNFKLDGTNISEDFFVVSVDRARFKERLLLDSLEIKINDKIFVDDSTRNGNVVKYIDSGRVYNLIEKGATVNNDYYGWLLPDIGIILIDRKKCFGDSVLTGKTAREKIDYFYSKLEYISLKAAETVTSNYVFARVRNSEFNYSINPSNIGTSGELKHDVMINSPQAYITMVGLYNDGGDLLAVAKLSRPLIKDFTKEALIRIKLDY